jgi:hypothetical protein
MGDLKIMKAGLGALVGAVCSTAFAFLLAGCAGMGPVKSDQPVEYVVTVQADGVWQNTGVYARKGELIECEAEGKWGDVDATYGPAGNKQVYKDHLGVAAPAYGLLMKLSTHTNDAFYVGARSNVVADLSGHVMFRNNVSLPHRSFGEVVVKLKVVHDADRDGVSDFDEVYIWGTDPLNSDTDGDGFSDLKEVMELKKKAENDAEDDVEVEK